MEPSIIQKIQKLLSLATSSNENEARAATNKANELLIKHNLSLQQINDVQFTYDSLLIIGESRFKNHQGLISAVIQKFFFVKVLIGWQKTEDARYKRKITLIGTKENAQIASYIFCYLDRTYPVLWKRYSKENSVAASYRRDYYTGLTKGIVKMLNETRWKVQNETGLIIKEDPKLNELAKSMAKGTHKPGKENVNPNSKVLRDGYEDGQKLNIHKPIESETKSNEIRFLTNQLTNN